MTSSDPTKNPRSTPWWCRRWGGIIVLATLLLTSAPAVAQTTAALTFGPATADFNGLPLWISAPGRQPCELDIPPGEDHGAYYALEAVGSQNGIRFKYVAAIEGLDALPGMPAPEVVNLVLVRLEGLVPGRTYTVEEPFGQFTTIVPTESRFVEEVTGADPAAGPITDFLPTGTFRVLDGTTVLINADADLLCKPFASAGGNEPPTARFTASCIEATCTFDGRASSDRDGSIASHGWDFGDGSPVATGSVVTHTYATGGTMTVTLGVTDDLGGFHELAKSVFVNLPPTPAFTFACVGLSCSFDASSSTDGDGAIAAYGWDFGDGTTAFGRMVNKTYASNGVRTVTLTTVDNGGSSRSTTREVNATVPITVTWRHSAGNEWWIQTRVTSSDGSVPSAVCVSINGGACRPLTLKSWGAWAASYHAPEGTRVTFTATFAAGSVTSGVYAWPSGAPVSGDGGPTPPPAGDLAATFRPYDGNNWWVQTKVSSSERITAVCASVDGGECRPLSLKSWGAWAKSFHVPSGAQVRFTATGASGATATSQPYTWPVR